MALQPKGARPPLFLVHAIGGEVLSYLTLARHLGDDQPVYGIRRENRAGAELVHERRGDVRSATCKRSDASRPPDPITSAATRAAA